MYNICHSLVKTLFQCLRYMFCMHYFVLTTSSQESTSATLGYTSTATIHEDPRVSDCVSSCFASLRHIRSIRRSVSKPVLMSLVRAMDLARLDYGIITLNNISQRLMNRLQSVLNAAARLVCISRKYDRISPLLRDLHWLRVPERIKFRLAVLVFRCRNHTAPEYLSRELQCVVDDESRRRLRSASFQRLVVRRTRLTTAGDRAFGTAAPRLWNSLPADVVASQSLATFKGQLKTFLFKQSHNPRL